MNVQLSHPWSPPVCVRTLDCLHQSQTGTLYQAEAKLKNTADERLSALCHPKSNTLCLFKNAKDFSFTLPTVRICRSPANEHPFIVYFLPRFPTTSICFLTGSKDRSKSTWSYWWQILAWISKKVWGRTTDLAQQGSPLRKAAAWPQTPLRPPCECPAPRLAPPAVLLVGGLGQRGL